MPKKKIAKTDLKEAIINGMLEKKSKKKKIKKKKKNKK
jgi:hypothetical protein